MRSEMTAEQMAIVKQALAKADADVSAETSEECRSVDALVVIAETILATETKQAKDKYVTNLSVSAETLADNVDGECLLDDQNVSAETSRRLSCNAPLVVSLVDANGVVLKMGRKTRLFKGAARAAVMKRDQGCCIYPGCNNRKWIDVHHIRHWTQGGLTNPENGAVLCGFHHRLVHEGGFSLDHQFVFRRPDGTIVAPQPVDLRPPPVTAFVDIGPDGCVSGGNGERMDVDLAVLAMSS